MALSPSAYRYLADLILILHFIIVFFIVGGLTVVWIGHWCDWSCVRNSWFRLAHLLVMGFIAVQTFLGRWCPLTVWEIELRQLADQEGYSGGFIQHWLQSILYYDLPPWSFTILYVAFFGLVLWTWRLVPPHQFGGRRPRDPAPPT